MDVEMYATKLGIDLYEEYTADEASRLLRVGVNSLNALAKEGEITYIQVGQRKKVFLGLDLVSWKLSKRIVSGTTTSVKTEQGIGAALGTTKPSNNARQVALVREMLKLQKTN